MPGTVAFFAWMFCGVHPGLITQPNDALAAWVSDQYDAARNGAALEYAHVTWRVEEVFVPPTAQLQALRRRVAGHPDHPERYTLEAYERRLNRGPDIAHYDIWLGSRSFFRQNLVGADGLIEDIVVRPGLSWSYLESSRHLNLVDLSANKSPEGYNYQPRDHQIRGTLAGFAYGAFSITVPGAPLALQTLAVDSDRWRAVFASEDAGLSLGLEGSWDADAHRGTADLAIILACDPAPVEVGRKWTFTDWEENDILAPQLCRVQTSYAPSGQAESIHTLEIVELITQGDFSFITTPPNPRAQSDSVRGPLVIQTVHKVSGGLNPSIVTVFDSTGSQLAEIPERDFDRNREQRLLSMSVLIGVPGVVAVVIGGALWRRMRGSQS
ncbi:MAG: hypothetical protein DYG94_14790 [Leptolyngbya sp. PLA3]|nr:MAG: hypothetical protein EDM82_15110 [Cyanobacteria bacterium CYA]MCE7969996.1 hypothetical protein [Leptolyngbya sp. PL-A3]